MHYQLISLIRCLWCGLGVLEAELWYLRGPGRRASPSDSGRSIWLGCKEVGIFRGVGEEELSKDISVSGGAGDPHM